MRLFDVNLGIRERLYREMISRRMRSIDADTVGVRIDSFGDCDRGGAQVAALIPAAGHLGALRFQLDGPGGGGTIARMVVPGEEAEILASWLAINAGLQ